MYSIMNFFLCKVFLLSPVIGFHPVLGLCCIKHDSLPVDLQASRGSPTTCWQLMGVIFLSVCVYAKGVSVGTPLGSLPDNCLFRANEEERTFFTTVPICLLANISENYNLLFFQSNGQLAQRTLELPSHSFDFN